MDNKLFYEDIVIVSPYEIQSLESFKISRCAGIHSSLFFKALVSSENIDNIKSINAENQNVIAKFFTKDSEVIFFQGVISNFSLIASNNVFYIEVTALSLSFNLDVKTKSKSFQHTAGLYSDIIKYITSNNNASFWIHDSFKNSKQNKLIIQYKETDWTFLKRIASHLGTQIFINDRLDKPSIFFGIPDSASKDIEYSPFYKVSKSIHDFLDSSVNFDCSLSEDNFVTYEIETTQMCFIGEKINFLGKTLVVIKVNSYLKRFYLYHKVVLASEELFRQNYIYNNQIKGLSFKGKILEAHSTNVKVNLNIDGDQSKDKAFVFPYSTRNASGGVGWYLMPKTGETVEIYFPSNVECEAYARGTDRGGNTSSLPPKSSTKELNVHGKKMNLGDEALSFTVDPENYVHVDQGNGIDITCSKDVIVYAKEDMTFDSKNITFEAKEEFFLICNDTSIAILGDGFNISASKFIAEGTIKAPIEQPKPKTLKEEAKEALDFVTSDGFLDGLQVGLSIVGMIPGIGVIPDLVNAGISCHIWGEEDSK